MGEAKVCTDEMRHEPYLSLDWEFGRRHSRVKQLLFFWVRFADSKQGGRVPVIRMIRKTNAWKPKSDRTFAEFEHDDVKRVDDDATIAAAIKAEMNAAQQDGAAPEPRFVGYEFDSEREVWSDE